MKDRLTKPGAQEATRTQERFSLFLSRRSLRHERLLLLVFHSSRSELGLQPPGLAVRLQRLAAPNKRCGRDVCEEPSYLATVRTNPFLDDIGALPASNQVVAGASNRIEPGDAPGREFSIVDSDGCSVQVIFFRYFFT